MNQDDFDFKTLESKYNDMTVDKINAMTVDERGEYYYALYQYFGRIIGIVHETKGALLDDLETEVYPNLSAGEYWGLSALHNSFMAVVDGLAGLMDMAEGTGDET